MTCSIQKEKEEESSGDNYQLSISNTYFIATKKSWRDKNDEMFPNEGHFKLR